jgi:hypothetical protein
VAEPAAERVVEFGEDPAWDDVDAAVRAFPQPVRVAPEPVGAGVWRLRLRLARHVVLPLLGAVAVAAVGVDCWLAIHRLETQPTTFSSAVAQEDSEELLPGLLEHTTVLVDLGTSAEEVVLATSDPLWEGDIVEVEHVVGWPSAIRVAGDDALRWEAAVYLVVWVACLLGASGAVAMWLLAVRDLRSRAAGPGVTLPYVLLHTSHDVLVLPGAALWPARRDDPAFQRWDDAPTIIAVPLAARVRGRLPDAGTAFVAGEEVGPGRGSAPSAGLMVATIGGEVVWPRDEVQPLSWARTRRLVTEALDVRIVDLPSGRESSAG